MREHIKILAILNIVMGSLTALGGLVVLLAAGSIASLIMMGLQDSGDAENARIAAPIVGVVGVIVGVFLLALAIPAILGGWGLLNYRSWSRVLMIVISGLSLLHFPIGTALGIYGLWVLLNEQSRQLLETGGALPPVGYVMAAPQPGSFPGAQPPRGV
jgi:hypothetical protein